MTPPVAATAFSDKDGASCFVDLRSDTVTQPTERMREVMMRAPVGDDCYGEDPSVLALESVVADLLGKERALFFPSGIMANQAAILAQGAAGEEVLIGARAHLLHYEEGSVAAHGGMVFRTVASDDGHISVPRLKEALRKPSAFQPRTTLLALENTHLDSGGSVLSAQHLEDLGELAKSAGLAIHLDGARLWNAAVASGVPERDLAAPMDTVMVCLSKGLGAPVGSMLAGPATVIEKAWRIRRRLGGQMRQVGMLAAAGLFALEHHRQRLGEDHRRAQQLAQGLSTLNGLRVTPPETNIVMIDLVTSRCSVATLLARLETQGVRMVPFGAHRVRAVVHLNVDDEGVAQAIRATSSVLESL